MYHLFLKVDELLHADKILKKFAGFSQIRFVEKGSTVVNMAIGFHSPAPLADPMKFTTDLKTLINGAIERTGNVCHLPGIGRTVCEKPPEVEGTLLLFLCCRSTVVKIEKPMTY
jgi:hypothetical protein